MLAYWAAHIADRRARQNIRFGIDPLARLALLVDLLGDGLDIVLVCGPPIAGVVAVQSWFLVYCFWQFVPIHLAEHFAEPFVKGFARSGFACAGYVAHYPFVNWVVNWVVNEVVNKTAWL